MRDFGRHTLADFSKTLGSVSSEPGGGAAAALVAATGMALLEMTARINDRRAKKQGMLATSAVKRVKVIEGYRRRLIKLMALDAKAFAEISKRRRHPKSSRYFQQALKVAAEVPMEIGEIALKGMALSAAERSRTSRWLASDLAEAGLFLQASLRAARLNATIFGSRRSRATRTSRHSTKTRGNQPPCRR